MRQRRFLPSIRVLLAFDAVVRHRSVTAAAQELSLTQSTVSRLVQTLEEQLGRELFSRQRKRLIPNAAALTYQKEIGRALDLIQHASTSVVVNPQGGSLSLAVLPTFATRWLGPRLGRFLQSHPGVALNMSTRIQRVDFSTEPFDAAIYFGTQDWSGLDHLKLFDERVTACASPAFLAQNPVRQPDDLQGLPLLHLQSRPTVWSDWFHAQGADVPKGGGMLMDQFSMVIQAAISGLGIALLPDYLAQVEITEGRLAPVLHQGVAVRGAYWLVWPPEKSNDAALLALRHWLDLNR
ncbi:LysR family transcriptional regulator [Thioclava sp. SK-1]|uniref:LysR family transcriptional regulator n=1 Tax=Thioclava sp. SK-1 TaxID=1889770 RepID=UPI000826FF49|nr:LysR family transcriptional regulator [Thioclava sp. SK-1]OCX58209.1 LysR family transcriptional regulator [Thioclava sp. SK-1]